MLFFYIINLIIISLFSNVTVRLRDLPSLVTKQLESACM